MTPIVTNEDRWDRLAALFDSARELPVSERSSFVQRASADPALKSEIESLLAVDGEDAIIDVPPAEAFAALIDDGPGVRVGDMIGPYRIDSPLGSGGMGEVYRACDTNLNRDVAIKILPASFANDPERLARFRREAQVLAALHHPNIAFIYGLEERPISQNGSAVTAIVMELVDGQTLAEQLNGGKGGATRIPLAEALAVARQMADAVETAHEQGIIHRDLKPANVKIRHDGTVKVLDFGLAKISEATGQTVNGSSKSPGIAAEGMTAPGTILGTTAYMSPEQTKGQPADKRSDVWAFGCVFFEMLTGTRPFDGQTAAETIASILKEEPDWSLLPPLPRAIEILLRRCLEKDGKKRLSDMSTVRFLLSDTLPLWIQPAPKTTLSQLGGLVAAAAVGVALVLLVEWARHQSAPLDPSSVSRFVTALPPAQGLRNMGRLAIAVSPDGRRFAYVAGGQLWRRSLETRDASPLINAGHPAVSPTFSPDGASVAFWQQGAIFSVAFDGGPLNRLYSVESMPYGMHWSSEGIFAAVQVSASPLSGSRIVRLDPETGVVLQIARSAEGETFYGPWPLPDGRGILVTISDSQLPGRWDVSHIALILPSGERRIIVANASDARLLPTGHLAYSVGGVVFAQPFDMRTLTVSGNRVAVLEGVGRSAPSTATSHYDVSATGTLVLVRGPQTVTDGAQALVVYSSDGKAVPLSLPEDRYENPRVSPGGRRLTFATNDDNRADVWVYDFDGPADRRRLTVGGRNRFPIWTHDARRIAYQSNRAGDYGIFWQAADGTGSADRLTTAVEKTAHVPSVWSPSGDVMLYEVVTPEDFQLWSYSVSAKQSQRLIATSSGAPFTPVFSPDGKWLAYHTQQESTSGVADTRNTVWVRPYPLNDDVYEVSSDGTSHHPAWTPDGKAVIYTVGAGQFKSREIQRDRGFGLGVARALSPLTLPTLPADAEARPFDVMPDNRFITATNTLDQARPGAAGGAEIEVVLNWFAELRSKFPTP